MNKKLKCVVFDFDGTLTKTQKGSSCWGDIWEEINEKETDAMLYKMYKSGQIDYNKWTDLVVAKYREKLVDKNTLEKLANKATLLNNLKEVFYLLVENDVQIYVLSGGIKLMIEIALKNLLPFVTSIEADDFEYDDNGVVLSFKRAWHNVENKREFLESLINENNFHPKEMLFVGNGENDETAFLANVNTLCLNPDGAHYEDKMKWHNVILSSDTLLDILPFLSIKNEKTLAKEK